MSSNLRPGLLRLRMVAGVAAGFNAPISGVFFAVETVLQKRSRAPSDNSGQVLAMSSALWQIAQEPLPSWSHDAQHEQSSLRPSPCQRVTTAKPVLCADGITVAAILLACVASSAVVQAGLGDNPAFRVPRYQLQGVAEIPLVLLLGALGGAVSAIFLYSSQVQCTVCHGCVAAGPLCAVCMNAVRGSACCSSS